MCVPFCPASAASRPFLTEARLLFLFPFCLLIYSHVHTGMLTTVLAIRVVNTSTYVTQGYLLTPTYCTRPAQFGSVLRAVRALTLRGSNIPSALFGLSAGLFFVPPRVDIRVLHDRPEPRDQSLEPVQREFLFGAMPARPALTTLRCRSCSPLTTARGCSCFLLTTLLVLLHAHNVVGLAPHSQRSRSCSTLTTLLVLSLAHNVSIVALAPRSRLPDCWSRFTLTTLPLFDLAQTA